MLFTHELSPAIIELVRRDGLRPRLDDDTAPLGTDIPPEIINLLRECWSQQVNIRPDIFYVHRVLNNMCDGCAWRSC